MAEPRVLMVDDNEAFLQAVSERLELRELTVDRATSGGEAVQLARSKRHDVVVLDLAMPGLDGVETLRQLKAEQPFVEAIMLTGQGSLDAAMRSGQENAFKFLTKPVELDELVGVIYDAFAEKRRRQAAAYQAELKQVLATQTTAHDIVARTRELARKYEQ